MTSAYGSADVKAGSTGKKYAHKLPYIPLRGELRDGTSVWIDFIHTSSDTIVVRKLLNEQILEGESWPFDKPLSDEAFRNYFFSHTALVARNDDGDIIGAFYCKPNFPGRCSQYCNGGFITQRNYRRRGVAQFMAVTYLRVAKDLGFRAVLFNLVFASNEASVRLWEKLGFTRIATLPKIASLTSGVSDAYQYHYDLEKLDVYKLSDMIVNGAHQKDQTAKEISHTQTQPHHNLSTLLERLHWTLPLAITAVTSFIVGRVSASR